MENKINIAIQNLREAILSEMDTMSKEHKKTLKELSELQNKYEGLHEEERKIIKKDAIEGFETTHITLDIPSLKLLFKGLCKHKKAYKLGENKTKFYWPGCEGCALNFIQRYHTPHGVEDYCTRSLCFAIWHDDILNQQQKVNVKS